MMGSRRCELCKTGKVRPMQLSPSQAIMMCDNRDCDYLFNSSPWDNIIIRNLSMHPLETPIDAESWIRASNSCSSSSGVHSDIKSPLFSPASSLVSLTDKEVEFLLQKSYAPPRVSSTSRNSVLGPSSWKKSTVRGSREHGRSSTKLGKRSGQVASALSITTAFDLPSEGMPAPRHSDTVPAVAELEDVAKNEFFDMLKELDLDTPPVNKNHYSSDSDLGDLPPLDSWMKEEYKGSQSEVGALENVKSFQGPHEGKHFEGSGSCKGDINKFSESGVPFIPSAGSAFSQVPPSKVLTPNNLAPVKEEVISNSLVQERGCDIESREEVETGGGDLLYAGALLADTQTSSPASSHGSEDSGYNEECRIVVGVQKPLKTQEHFGTPTQVLTTKDSRDFSFSNGEEVCATNIKESSHPEEVIKYLINPVTMSNMINVYEYSVLPAVVSPNNTEKSVDSFEKSTNVLEVSSESGVEKSSSQESRVNTSVRPSLPGQNVPQLIEDTVSNVSLHSPRSTHSLLKPKSLDSKSSDANDSKMPVIQTQNGVAPIEWNHTKPCISSEARKECLETKIDNCNLIEDSVTSLSNISGVELGEHKKREGGSSSFVTETTLLCNDRQSSEVLQPPSVSKCAEKMEWPNDVLEKMLLEEQHGFLGNLAMETNSDSNIGAGTVQEGYEILCQSRKDKQSSSGDQSQIEKCPSVSENVSRVSSDGDTSISIRESSSSLEEMNRQDSLSPSSDMGSIDKAPCSPEKIQPIKRGPGRPRGRGRPKNKNKSVPSTDPATSRGAPTTAKVGASSSVGYVRESRSRKRRNLETRAYNMPREDDWENNDKSELDSADIRKGISELLPSSYLQLTRGRKTSRWSGGAKTATYNCSTVEDEADVEELYVEVIVEGCRNFDLPLYLQHHLRRRQKLDESTSDGSQEKQQQQQDEKMQGKSKWSLKPKDRHERNRKYFEGVLANVDFDEQFFQCPTNEHDKEGSSLDELSDGVLLFGQTGEEHSGFKEDQRLSCDTVRDNTHSEGASSAHVGVDVENPYFLPDPGYGLVKQEMKTSPGASQEFGQSEGSCTEKAAKSLLMLASRGHGHSSGMCAEQNFYEASQNVQFILGNEAIFCGSKQSSLSFSDGNTKTQANILLSPEGKAIRGEECMKQGRSSTTADAVDRKHRNVLALDDTVKCFSHLSQPQGIVFQPCSLLGQYPNPVQSDQNLVVNEDKSHDIQQGKQVVQNKEERQRVEGELDQLECDIQKKETCTGEGKCSVNLLSRIDSKNIQTSTDTIVPSLVPITEEDGTVGMNDSEFAMQTLAGSSRIEPIFSTGENLNRVGVMDCQQGTPRIKEENLHSPRYYSSTSDSHQSNVQMCHITPHTPKQQSRNSPLFLSSPSHYDDSDNDIPSFTLDDMEEIHVLLPKKRKKNGGMGEGREYKKLKKEVVEDLADCSMASIDFDDVPLCCGILDSTFVHEECCALRGSVVDSSLGKNASGAGQKLFGICYARKSNTTKRISDGHSKRFETFLNTKKDTNPAAVASPLVIDVFVKDEEQAEKRIMEEEAAYGDIKHSPQFQGIWSPGSDSSQPGLLDLDISLSTIEPFTDLFSWSPESGEITYNADEQEMVDVPGSSEDANVEGSINKAEGGITSLMGNGQNVSAKDSIQKAEERSIRHGTQQVDAKGGKLKAKGSGSHDLIKPGIGQRPRPNVVTMKGPGKVLTGDTEPVLKPVSSHKSHEGMLSSAARATPSIHHVTPSTSSNFPPSSHAHMFPVPTPYSQAVHLYTHDSGPAPHVAQLSGTSLTFTDHMLYPRVPQVSTTELMGIDCKDVSQLEPTTIVPPALISSYCGPEPSRQSLSVRRGQSQWAAVKPITMVQKLSSKHNRAGHGLSTRRSDSTLPLPMLKTKVSLSYRETISENSGKSVSSNSGENFVSSNSGKSSASENIGEMFVSGSVGEPSSKISGESSFSKTAGKSSSASTSKLGEQRTVTSLAKESTVNPGSKQYIDSTNIPKMNTNLPNSITNLPKTDLTPKAEPVQAVVIGNTFVIKAHSMTEPKTMKPSVQGCSQKSKSVVAPVIVTQNAVPIQVTLEKAIKKPSAGVYAQEKKAGDNGGLALAKKSPPVPLGSDVSEAHLPSQNITGTLQMLTPALNPGATSASSVGNQPAKSSPASSSSLPGSSIKMRTSGAKTSNTAGIPEKISSKAADKIGELCQSTSDDTPKVILVNVGDKTFLYRREDK